MIQNQGYVVRGLPGPESPQLFTESFEQAKRYVARAFMADAQRMLDAQNYAACLAALAAAKSALNLRGDTPGIPRARPYWRAVSSDARHITISEVVRDAAVAS